MSAVFARNEKRTNSMRNLSKKQLENTSKKACRKACKKHAKIIKKSSKIPPKIDPGGLRRPLASQLGAWSLPKLLPEPSGASKKLYDRARGRPGAPLEPFFIEKKTWLSWNGKREKRKSVKHCRQGESSESRKNSKKRSARTT